jgi:hypothetical protein
MEGARNISFDHTEERKMSVFRKSMIVASFGIALLAGCSTAKPIVSESSSFRKHLDRCIVLNATADLDPGEKVEDAKCHKDFHFISPSVNLPPPNTSDGYGMGGGMGMGNK